MEKQKTTAVRIEVMATNPFMFDPYAYEEAVIFFQDYAQNTWKKVSSPSFESPTINNKEGFQRHP